MNKDKKSDNNLTPISDKNLLSYTRFGSFMNCPYKFHLKYQKGIRPKIDSVKFSFGKAMHEALAYYYENNCSLELVMEYFSIVWNEMTRSDSIDYGTKKVTKAMIKEDPELASEQFVKIRPEYYLDLGLRMLESYFNTYGDEKLKIEGVEQSFTCPFKNPKTNYTNRKWELTGIVDLIIDNGDGTYDFWDHKMMGKKVSAKGFQLSHQIPTYFLGVANLLGVPVSKIRKAVFNIIYKNGDLECERIEMTRTQEEIDEFQRQLTMVSKAIDNNRIFQNFNFSCVSCEYVNYCRGEKEGFITERVAFDPDEPDEL